MIVALLGTTITRASHPVFFVRMCKLDTSREPSFDRETRLVQSFRFGAGPPKSSLPSVASCDSQIDLWQDRF